MTAASSSPARPTPAVTRAGLGAYALAVVVVALDQVSKWWVLAGLRLPERPDGRLFVAPPALNLTFVPNYGISFGFLKGERWALVIFSVAVAVALALWARRAHKGWSAAALGLLIGGALGNAVDRARQGFVTDFIDVSGLHFPWVFNVADAAINIGVAILVIESLFAPKKP